MRAGHEFHLGIADDRRGTDGPARLHAAGRRAHGRGTGRSPTRARSGARRRSAEHRAILDAIVARDPEAARARAEEHVRAARDVALDAIGGRLDAR